jgi:citrate lyase subunit beta / citryl-CoA lyase
MTSTPTRRPPELRRSWLFVPGADRAALTAAAQSGADVLIQELEDFTPPSRRGEARALAPDVFRQWRAAGRLAAVRVNPLAGDGRADLEAVMKGRPDIVMLPKVDRPEHVIELARAVERLEQQPGATELVPNIESARGLVATIAIVTASPRVSAALVASEDMAADLGAERGRDAAELDYVRRRFHVECVAAGIVSIDCPYTWQDPEGALADARQARRLGYRAKSAVALDHARLINAVLTPSAAEVDEARRLVTAFEAARAAGLGRAELDGSLVEWPGYMNAKRLIARAEALAVFET